MNILTQPVPNEEASAFIREKAPMTRDVFDRMLPELRARAFVITGVEYADVLQRARDHIAELPRGGDWNTIKHEVAAEISPYLVGETASVEEQAKAADAAESRAELLLRIHGFQAYAATQHEVMVSVKDDFPWWQYQTVGDDNVRESHAALDGKVFSADDEFWADHSPPWEWGCRCLKLPKSRHDFAEQQKKDSGKNPEDRLVVEGARLDKLHREGIMDNGLHDQIDVRSPVQRADTPEKARAAFSWHPGDLRIPVEQLEARYDKPVWDGFEAFAKRTRVFEDDKATVPSVWDWLHGAKLESPKAMVVGKIAFDDARRSPSLDWMDGAAARKVRTAEEELRGLENERALVFDGHGRQLVSVTGDANSVQMTTAEARKARDGVLTHNHPSGGPFSLKDLTTGFTYGVRELRAVAPDGGVFVLTPQAGRLDASSFDNVNKAWKRLITGNETASEAHEKIRRIASENGLRYAFVEK